MSLIYQPVFIPSDTSRLRVKDFALDGGIQFIRLSVRLFGH